MSALLKTAYDRMSVTEFLAWDSGDQSGRPWQLIDGVPQAMAPATRTHAAMMAELARLIGNHLVESRRDCQVLVEPGIVPRARAGSNIRIPDLAVACGLPTRDHLLQDPVLVIEILSPSNANETYANVWTYTTIPSLQEILIISSSSLKAELLRRLPDGSWPESPEPIDFDQPIELSSIGMTLPMAAAYRGSGLSPDETTKAAQPPLR